MLPDSSSATIRTPATEQSWRDFLASQRSPPRRAPAPPRPRPAATPSPPASRRGRAPADSAAAMEFSPEEEQRRLRSAGELLNRQRLTSLVPLLPLVFNLRGEPYTLDDHFVFEPFFSLHMPRSIVIRSGRQVSKSTSLAAQGVLLSNVIPFFNTLYVTPLFEMIRRFSNDYVKAFIEQSPVRHLWMDTTTTNSVLQRSFRNHSKMYFSFAYLTADRTRGIAGSRLAVDETQDLDWSLVPVLRETLSGERRWGGGGLEQWTGTPKTTDGSLAHLSDRSSQAEWAIRCEACRHINIPSLSHDLLAMMGPWREDISREKPALICARPACRRTIYPRTGRWYHAYPERRLESAGYHVPQQIMPMHCESPQAWKKLLAKQQGAYGMPLYQFYNEVCGESWDVGAKLISQADLKAAATLHPNHLETARHAIGGYLHRILAIDWGGAGEDETSFTCYAVLGIQPSGVVDCLYGYRSPNPYDHVGEAQIALKLAAVFQCSHLAHDYTGAGDLRETILVQSGFPVEKIIPTALTGHAKGPILSFEPATQRHPRDYYQVDKARSLVLTSHLIKACRLRFFQYDYIDPDRPGLLHDFLALIENKRNTAAGGDVYLILRNPAMPDDFAQAVNIGAMCLFHLTGQWPNIAAINGMRASQALLLATHPLSEQDWEDLPFLGY